VRRHLAGALMHFASETLAARCCRLKPSLTSPTVQAISFFLQRQWQLAQVNRGTAWKRSGNAIIVFNDAHS
jgi:predicted transcriptional regulator